MDYSMNKEFLSAKDVIFDGCQEQPVDLDFSLPDYCPDIQKILKCQVYPHINMKNISGDRLDVDGTAVVRLLYMDSVKMSVRCCEHSIPFSCTFNLKSAPQNAISFVKANVEYINCRAISPRRLDIHGAFSVCAKIVSKCEQEIASGIDEAEMQQKKIIDTASNMVGMGQQMFSINETLEIGQGKPAAQAIVRTDVSASINDYKIITNKLILKGEAFVKVLYISDMDEGNLETMEYSIPISQILDIDGIDETCDCSVSIDVMAHNIEIKSDSSGNDTLLDAEIKLSAQAIAYEEKEIELIEDAYSTEYEISPEYKQITVPHLLENISDTYINKSVIEMPQSGVSKVEDIWNEVSSVTSKKENNNIVFRGKINICILARDNENTPFYIERPIDFEYEHNWEGKEENINCEASINSLTISFRIDGTSGIEVRSDMKMNADVYANNSYKVIQDVSVDKDSPKQKDTTAALTIYFAEQGESVWNIARKYCTSAEAIKQENDLSCDVLENSGMILIPM